MDVDPASTKPPSAICLKGYILTELAFNGVAEPLVGAPFIDQALPSRTPQGGHVELVDIDDDEQDVIETLLREEVKADSQAHSTEGGTDPQAYDALPLHPDAQILWGNSQRDAIATLRSVGIIMEDADVTDSQAAALGLRHYAIFLDADAVLLHSSEWKVRHALVMLAVSLPPRRLQLWLDIVFSYVMAPSVQRLLSPEQVATIHLFKALPVWARCCVGVSTIFTLIPYFIPETGSDTLLATLSVRLQASALPRLALPALPGISNDSVKSTLHDWLLPGKQKLWSGGRAVIASKGSSSCFVAVDGWKATPRTVDLVGDTARLMLGYGPGEGAQVNGLMSMILSLSGLSRCPRPRLPAVPWAFFITREIWFQYKASLAWLQTIRTVALRLATGMDGPGGRTQSLGLLKSALSHAVQLRGSVLAWRSPTSVRTGVATGAENGIPPLHRYASVYRAKSGPPGRPEYYFQMPFGDSMSKFPQCCSQLAKRSNPVRVFCTGIWLAGCVLALLFPKKKIAVEISKEDLNYEGITNRDESHLDDPGEMLKDAARYFLFVALRPYPDESIGMNGLQVKCLIALGNILEETSSDIALSWLIDVVPAHLVKQTIVNIHVQGWKEIILKRKNLDQEFTPARTFNINIPELHVRMERFKNVEWTFVSDSTKENGKQRALFTLADGFYCNVERLVIDEVVRNSEFRDAILSGLHNRQKDISLQRREIPRLENVFILPSHLLGSFASNSFLLNPLIQQKQLRKFLCDDNIMAQSTSDDWCAFHSENILLPTLLACFIWPDVTSEDASWKHPFASMPFSFNPKWKQYDEFSHCKFALAMRDNYKRGFGADMPRARWDLVGEDLVTAVCHAAGPLVVSSLCEKLFSDFANLQVGMPDIVVFRGGECSGDCGRPSLPTKDFFYLEVKSHSDRIREGQTAWLGYMLSKDITAGILHFCD